MKSIQQSILSLKYFTALKTPQVCLGLASAAGNKAEKENISPR